jgi:hypothetical protein
LLAFGVRGSGAHGIVDALTGRDLLALDSFQVPGTDGLLFYRDDPNREGLVRVATLDAQRGFLRQVGLVATIGPYSCHAGAGYLACLTRRGELRVWRYPPTA